MRKVVGEEEIREVRERSQEQGVGEIVDKEEKVRSQDVKQEGKAQKSEYLPWGCTRKGR